MEKVNTMQEQMGIISRNMERIKTSATKKKKKATEMKSACDGFHSRFKTALNQLLSLKYAIETAFYNAKRKRNKMIKN